MAGKRRRRDDDWDDDRSGGRDDRGRVDRGRMDDGQRPVSRDGRDDWQDSPGQRHGIGRGAYQENGYPRQGGRQDPSWAGPTAGYGDSGYGDPPGARYRANGSGGVPQRERNGHPRSGSDSSQGGAPGWAARDYPGPDSGQPGYGAPAADRTRYDATSYDGAYGNGAGLNGSGRGGPRYDSAGGYNDADRYGGRGGPGYDSAGGYNDAGRYNDADRNGGRGGTGGYNGVGYDGASNGASYGSGSGAGRSGADYADYRGGDHRSASSRPGYAGGRDGSSRDNGVRNGVPRNGSSREGGGYPAARLAEAPETEGYGRGQSFGVAGPEFSPAAGESSADANSQLFGRLTIFTLSDDKVAEFDRLAERAVEAVRAAEPDTLIYVIHDVPKAPMQRIIYEAYRGRAAYESHQRQPHTIAFAQERKSCVVAINIIDLQLKNAKIAPLEATSPASGPAAPHSAPRHRSPRALESGARPGDGGRYAEPVNGRYPESGSGRPAGAGSGRYATPGSAGGWPGEQDAGRRANPGAHRPEGDWGPSQQPGQRYGAS